MTLAKEYSYKNLSGNRTTTQVSGYTAKVNGPAVDSCTYGNAQWVDQLTELNGEEFDYDDIGNPLSYYNGYGKINMN